MSDEHPSAASGVFRRPFTEQVAFFRRKLRNLVPTERWDDLVRQEHDDAFMVAGAVKADLLTDLAAAVDKSIAEGRGLEEFRRDFRDIVQRNGWTGWTGEGSVKGEAWRAGVIYRTNSYTSYAAGRFAQLKAGNFKYWVYRHGGSLEPRPVHLDWDGIALPPEHPFWQTHYPPSDWGCSCYVVGARTKAGIRRVGGDPNKTLPDNWRELDPKTGAPIGVGKNWDYAPGASAADAVNAMAWKLGNWDHRVAKAFMEALSQEQADAISRAYRNLPSTRDDARRYARRIWRDLETSEPGRTLGMLRGDQVNAVGRWRDLDVSGFDFSLTADEVRHVRRNHGDLATELRRGQRRIAPEDFAMLPRVLEEGSTPRFVGMSRGRDRPIFEIVLEIDGETYVTRWEYWRRRRSMSLLSFFVRTGERG